MGFFVEFRREDFIQIRAFCTANSPVVLVFYQSRQTFSKYCGVFSPFTIQMDFT